MSGHSKWATIHRQKGIKDAKKGAVFTKLAGAIVVAVKAGGGGDPDQNFRLRLAGEKARQFNMPKDNIARPIEKGTGSEGGADLTEVMYEGFLPGGAGVLIEAVTDNKVRTAQTVRSILDKAGGNMAGNGAVSHMFNHEGEVRFKIQNSRSNEEQELEAIDLGINDINDDDGSWVVYCDKDKTFEIKDKLEKMGYEVESAELVMRPTTMVDIGSDELRERVERILEQLEDLDDVHRVWSNYA